MKNKILFFLAFTLLIIGSAGIPLALSSNDEDASVLPNKEGVYKVPGKPNLRLRVFIYHGKDEVRDFAKPSSKPSPVTPALICNSISTIDQDSLSLVKSAGWIIPSSWTYRVNTTSAPSSVGSSAVGNIVLNSYKVWADAVSNKVSFLRGADTSTTVAQMDKQNIVTWGKTSPTALAVSYIWYDSISGIALEIDTIFNKSFTWYWSNPTTWPVGQACAYKGVYDAQNILTHEFGHTLGLSDEYTSEFINNTMYGYGSVSEIKKNTLSTGDIFSVSSLYQ